MDTFCRECIVFDIPYYIIYPHITYISPNMIGRLHARKLQVPWVVQADGPLITYTIETLHATKLQIRWV